MGTPARPGSVDSDGMAFRGTRGHDDRHPYQNSYPFPALHDESSSLTRAPSASDAATAAAAGGGGQPGQPSNLQLPSEPERFPPLPDQTQYMSPSSESREQATRLHDELTVLKLERATSNDASPEIKPSQSRRLRPRDVREAEKEDVFNAPDPSQAISPPQLQQPSPLNHVFRAYKKLPRGIRYFFYMIPVAAVLLTPVLLGIFLPPDQRAVIGGPGGVELLWFGIWLEVVWLSLFAARILTSILPFVLGFGAKFMTTGGVPKWKEIGRALELHLALFLWGLAVLISFLPLVNTHKVPARVPEEADEPFPRIEWIDVVYKIIISLFVLAVLNLVEKVLIQWIAESFHLRTYSTRIALNKQSIA